MAQNKHYPDVNPNPDFAALEQEVLQFWAEDKTFEKSVSQRPHGNGNDYVFYDGPPFANGLPHYGHLLTGYVKDAIARYQTMRGKRVERRFGWDCHGLPAEMGAEKELNITGRAAIIHYGIDKFNDYCRNNVMRYVADWEYYVTRQGRWVDFRNDYKTMDKNFMESVIWAFSELHKKGLVYEAFRVMPYSWAAETPLSNFETRMDNATREREDKAAYVRFKLADGRYLIAWTTTPWTLPSNLALAVSPTMEYAAVAKDGATLIVAKSAVEKLFGKEAESAPVSGNDLIGQTYEPLFPYFANNTPTHRLTADALDTQSYRLRPFAAADEDAYFALVSNPQTMATIGGGVRSKEEASKELAAVIAHQQEHGFSIWAVEDKQSGAVVGKAGFTYVALDANQPAQPSLHYLFAPEAWGKGAAKEVAKLWVDTAFAKIGFRKIVAASLPDNAASVSILKKLDFAHHSQITFKDKVCDYYERSHAFRVIDGKDAVTEGEGTGVIHMAPGFGEIDQKICAENGIEVVVPVDGQGKFTNEIYDIDDLSLHGLIVVPDTRITVSSIQVSDADAAQHIDAKDIAKYGLANMRIVRWLKKHGKLVKDEPYKHNYPHCWRTDTPIIYRAMSSWYVAVTKFRDRAVEINQQINWIPEHVKNGQMGHMLATAPDWSISRNRFWGTPIPIWRAPSGKMMVPDSIEQIEQWSGVKVADLHRPMIDQVTFEKDGETYTRVEDVFDCWFESGSMPYAQMHYMGEKTKDPAVKKKFEENFPADFITEYVGQTRGWFNTMIMLSTALFDKPPFQNCICHGVVIDEETGLKYSKRLKNYKDPKEVMDAFGADALRWMMLASPVMRGADIGVDPEGKFIRDVVRLNIKPLWSAYNFFTLYANADGIKAVGITSSDNTLDRYILAKAKAAVQQAQASLDAYDTPGATEAITAFFDVLNNWYIRRSRARFWDDQVTADKTAAFNTLYTVLNLMVKVAAPLLPFTTEAIYRGINGQQGSVHLQDFPKVDAIADDLELISDMDRVRDACTAMGSIRSAENIRNRQPLASATLYGAGADRLRGFAALMEDELNVKEIRFSNTLEGVAEYTLTINFPIAGKRLGGKMKAVGAAAKTGDWKNENGTVIVGDEPMEAGEYNLQLKPLIDKGAQRLSSNDALVVLDLVITPELEAEGRARDLVRMVQQARKDAGLHVADRIALALDLPEDFRAALAAHRDYIAEQVLAVSIGEGAAASDQQLRQELDGAQFVIGISKAA